jgi:anti-anti-sigma factor
MFKIEPCTHGDDPCLKLQGGLTIYAITEARDLLCAALDQRRELQLDLSGLEELDTSGVQLLAWMKQEARRQGKRLALFGHSPAVVEIFELLNVAGWFGDAILIAPSVA